MVLHCYVGSRQPAARVRPRSSASSSAKSGQLALRPRARSSASRFCKVRPAGSRPALHPREVRVGRGRGGSAPPRPRARPSPLGAEPAPARSAAGRVTYGWAPHARQIRAVSEIHAAHLQGLSRVCSSRRCPARPIQP